MTVFRIVTSKHMNNPFEAWNDFHLRQMQKIGELMKERAAASPYVRPERTVCDNQQEHRTREEMIACEDPDHFPNQCSQCNKGYDDEPFELEAIQEWGVCTHCDHILGSLRR